MTKVTIEILATPKTKGSVVADVWVDTKDLEKAKRSVLSMIVLTAEPVEESPKRSNE